MYALAASKRYMDVPRSDTVKIDTTKMKNNPQIPKPFSPDSVQRDAAGLKKDTVLQVPVSPQNDIENGQRKKTVPKPKILD
jgi:hypothetical protein